MAEDAPECGRLAMRTQLKYSEIIGRFIQPTARRFDRLPRTLSASTCSLLIELKLRILQAAAMLQGCICDFLLLSTRAVRVRHAACDKSAAADQTAEHESSRIVTNRFGALDSR